MKVDTTPEERLEYITTKWEGALKALADGDVPKGIPPLRIRNTEGGFTRDGLLPYSRAAFHFKSVADMKASTDYQEHDVGKICRAIDVWREVEYIVWRVYKDGTADLRALRPEGRI